jgi:S1-C subfamily serine protease
MEILKYSVLCVFFLLTACVSSHKITITDRTDAKLTYEDFVNGDMKLPKGVHTKTSFASYRGLIDNKHYPSYALLNGIISRYPESDVAYYILGKVAEKSKFYHAASNYYSKSMDDSLPLKFCSKLSQKSDCPIDFTPIEAKKRVLRLTNEYCISEYNLSLDVNFISQIFSPEKRSFNTLIKFKDSELLSDNGKYFLSNCESDGVVSVFIKSKNVFNKEIKPSDYSEDKPFDFKTIYSDEFENLLLSNLEKESNSSTNIKHLWSKLSKEQQSQLIAVLDKKVAVIKNEINKVTSLSDWHNIMNYFKFTKKLLSTNLFLEQTKVISLSFKKQFHYLVKNINTNSDFLYLIQYCSDIFYEDFKCSDSLYFVAYDLPMKITYGGGLNSVISPADLPEDAFGILFSIEKISTKSSKVNSEIYKSSFLSHSYMTPSSEYDIVKMDYERAILNYENYISSLEYQNNSGGFALGILRGMNKAVLKKEIDNLEKQLLKTPTQIVNEVYSDYQYSVDTINAESKISGNVYLFNKSENWYRKSVVEFSSSETFKLSPNAKDSDKLKYSSASEVEIWLNKPHGLKLPSMRFSDKSGIKKVNSAFNLSVLSKPTSVKKDITDIENAPKFLPDPRFSQIVKVKNLNGSFGTGFYFKKGMILTNAHVISDNDKVIVFNHLGQKATATLVARDDALDIAMLKTELVGTPVKFASAKIMGAGQTVQAIGHPNGFDYSITSGVISGVRAFTSDSGDQFNYIQTDAAISPGNSGGPLYLKNHVIGMNTFKRVGKDIDGLAFSIHYEEIMNFIIQNL